MILKSIEWSSIKFPRLKLLFRAWVVHHSSYWFNHQALHESFITNLPKIPKTSEGEASEQKFYHGVGLDSHDIKKITDCRLLTIQQFLQIKIFSSPSRVKSHIFAKKHTLPIVDNPPACPDKDIFITKWGQKTIFLQEKVKNIPFQLLTIHRLVQIKRGPAQPLKIKLGKLISSETLLYSLEGQHTWSPHQKNQYKIPKNREEIKKILPWRLRTTQTSFPH